jgi:DNA invertase Pin-like site-specific DNA recombinase
VNSRTGTAPAAVERHACPQCQAPAGSACRTRSGTTAAKYHTARFMLVPSLREELAVPTPTDRGPGRTWQAGPAVEEVLDVAPGRAIRIGYARCSMNTQELASQIDALQRADCKRIFSEKISTRVKVRPELENALKLARDIKHAAGEQSVILTVHEMKRLARNAAELMTLATTLQTDGIQLELLTGPLSGIYDPTGMGAMLFAVCAVAAQLDRDYIREKTLEGQRAAAARGNHGGRPKVIDDDTLIFARALREKGVPIPKIAKKLTIKAGKNAGEHPSVASLYRALAEPIDTGDLVGPALPLSPTSSVDSANDLPTVGEHVEADVALRVKARGRNQFRVSTVTGTVTAIDPPGYAPGVQITFDTETAGRTSAFALYSDVRALRPTVADLKAVVDPIDVTAPAERDRAVRPLRARITGPGAPAELRDRIQPKGRPEKS